MAVAGLHETASLARLLDGFAVLPALAERRVAALCADSREARAGCLFFARPGRRVDGMSFADEAARAGAVAIVRQGPGGCRARRDGVVEVSVPDIAACMGVVATRFHDHPAARLRVIGVTGTNGKTSVSHFVAGALHGCAGAPQDGAPCGVIGTLGYGMFGTLDAGLHTTPDVLRNHALLARMRAGGARAVVMEVSSHALDQGRVAGVAFDTAVFTNLTRDHLDYHADMHDYGEAKRRLFQTGDLRLAVVNLDDGWGGRMLCGLRADVRSVGCTLRASAASTGAETLAGTVTAAGAAGMRMEVNGPWGTGVLETPLVGRFNASNLLLALAVLAGSGMPFATALARLARALPPPGRMERFGGRGGAPLVVVDYAHTPDALQTVLGSLREQCRGRLWCVFGCGGDRDPGKRPLMGEVAARLAQLLIVTDDNPRNEDGERIVRDILDGIAERARVRVQRDRGAAITEAVMAADPDDVVLVAGKGHESYQDSGGKRRPFSDAAAVRTALSARTGARGQS